MCADEGIPTVNRVQQIQETLTAIEATSEQGQDIFVIDRAMLDSNDEVVDGMNHIAGNLDPERIQENLLNAGRIRMEYFPASDYENIFNTPGLRRRSERTAEDHQNSQIANYGQMMWEWLCMCVDDPSKAGDQWLPGDITTFEQFMITSLPAKLDVNTDIAKILLNVLINDLDFDLPHADRFRAWEPRLGTNGVLYARIQNGARIEYSAILAFIGTPQEGRLVWAPMVKHHANFGFGRGIILEVEKIIKQAEEALSALARRIARHVAYRIVSEYAEPVARERGYPVLTRKQIGSAVREILGEEWFDLPFDVDGSLKGWSEDDVLKPDAEIVGWDMFVEG